MTWPSDVKDASGNAISEGKQYVVFVMSMAGEGYVDNLSGGSKTFLVGSTTAVQNSQIVGSADFYVSGELLVIRNLPENGVAEIYTISGIKLMNTSLVKGDNYVNISGIKDAFIVNIQSEGKSQSKKFVRE
jgi:hypothetical protein